MNSERTCGASPSNDGLGPLYPQRDIVAQGQHYMRHLEAMTCEGLHAKSDIAAELAARDIEIERLKSAVIALDAAGNELLNSNERWGLTARRVAARRSFSQAQVAAADWLGA